MERQVSDLEELFEDHNVWWFSVACSLDVEHAVHMRRGAQREVPTWAQLTNRRQEP